MDELQPCPFCGNKAYYSDIGGFEHHAGCDNSKCHQSLSGYVDERDWNTRPIEDKLRSENESLKRVLEAAEKVKCYAGSECMGTFYDLEKETERHRQAWPRLESKSDSDRGGEDE